MPYRVDPKNKKCVQVKKSGKWQRKGCTDGPVKKYLSALYANSKDINENEWWEDIGEKLMKFGSIRKYLQEGDIINLTGDIKDSEGGVDVSLNEEPFIVVRNVNEGKMVILRFLNFSKPDDLPEGWHFVANSNNGDVSFRNFTKKYDDELIVTFNNDNRLNENVEDSEWWQDILKNKLKFGGIRKNLKKGDIIELTGDINYSDGENILTINEEPFIVIQNTKEGERLKLKFLKPEEELPPNWDNAANNDGEIIFDDATKEYDDKLDVVTVQYSKKLNENTEDSEWYMDIINKPGSAVLEFRGKEIMIDVRDFELEDKERLLKTLEPYFNENTNKRYRSEKGEDWSPKCLLKNKDVKTLSLHCGTNETNFMPEAGNTCCLGHTYEEENQTPKELITPLDGRFVLYGHKLNESESNEDKLDWVEDILKSGLRRPLPKTPVTFDNWDKYINIKVVRGRDWDHADYQDNNGESLGEIISEPYDEEDGWWIEVEWDNGHKNIYRIGDRYYDLYFYTPAEYEKLNESESNEDKLDWVDDILKSGLRGPLPNTPVTLDNWDKYPTVKVVRGRDWDWDEQDNDGGSLGEIISRPYKEPDGWWIVVKWDYDRSENSYRIGEHYFDLYFDSPYNNLNESKEVFNWDKDFANLIIEGRYDRITGVVVRDVMRYINNVVDEGDFEESHSVELPDESISQEIDFYSEGDIDFTVEVNIYFNDLDTDFELISAVSKFTDEDDYDEDDYDDESHTISLDLYLNKTKDKSFFEKIYYKLTEDVRHEIEHFIQTESNLRYGKKSKKPKPKSIEDFEEGDFFGHHTNKAEVEALTQGFYLRAKRERKPLDVVIQEYLDEILEQEKITPKQKTTILKKLLKYAKKNLPKAIYQQK